ncbi:MAG TPA: 30S ribosomal protein S11 [bacterium]|jgi:small subunit ribosomal protein S11
MGRRRQRTTKKKSKRQVSHGVAHIKSTFNNTIITISDDDGATLVWASGGSKGFKGSRKSTPFAATQAARDCAHAVQDMGMRKIDIFTKGPGSGREASIRALMSSGLDIGVIRDISPVPHNGCRPRKRRRV